MLKLSAVAALAALIVALPLAPGQAQQVALNVKPGLWQMTSHEMMSGQILDDAQLTAEQRAKLEALMGKPMQPRLYKECLTAEKLQQGLQQQAPAGATCQRSVQSNTPTDLQMRNQCTEAKGTRVLSVHVQTSEPQSLASAVTMAITQNGKTMTIQNDIQGKWLSADCGGVTNMQPN